MVTIISLILTLVTSLSSGRLLLQWLRVRLSQLPMWLLSLAIGSAFVDLCFFGLGVLLPFTATNLYGLLLVLLGISAWFGGVKLTFTDTVILIKDAAQHRRLALVIISFVVLLVWLFGRALFYDANGAFVAGDRLVWTDWPLHLAIATNFAYGANFPPQNPLFAGMRLTYPFMADLFSGALLSMGVSLPAAFVVPGIMLGVCFLGLFALVLKEIVNESRYGSCAHKLVFLAILISLFWGGMGFVYWLFEAVASPNPLSWLLSPAREYSFWQEKNLWFFTFLYSELLPQRAFLFGLPLFFAVALLSISAIKQRKPRGMAVAGVIAGLLPFFHTHTFIAVWILGSSFVGLCVISIVGSSFSRKISQKNQTAAVKIPSFTVLPYIAYFFIPFALLSLLQIPFFIGQSQQIIKFEFGWMKGDESFWWFWFKNTGFFIPLALIGWWKGKFKLESRVIGSTSWVLFIVPNIISFAAWGYDNLKIFTYWYLLESIFVAVGLAWFWQYRIGKWVSIFLCISLIATGVIEISRLVPTNQIQIGLWSKADQTLAEAVREELPARATYLTAAIHDHPLNTLAGRSIVIGYPGNIWSWGIAGWDTREHDVHSIYQGKEGAEQLWQKYAIDFIVVGERERVFEPALNENYIAKYTDLVLEIDNTKIYKTR